MLGPAQPDPSSAEREGEHHVGGLVGIGHDRDLRPDHRIGPLEQCHQTRRHLLQRTMRLGRCPLGRGGHVVEAANLAGRAVDQHSIALGDVELADTAHGGHAPLAGDDRSVARHPTAPAHDRRRDPHRRLVLGAGLVDEQHDFGAPFPCIERRRGVDGDLPDTDAGRCGEAHPEQNTVGRRTDRGRRDPEDHVVDQRRAHRSQRRGDLGAVGRVGHRGDRRIDGLHRVGHGTPDTTRPLLTTIQRPPRPVQSCGQVSVARSEYIIGMRGKPSGSSYPRSVRTRNRSESNSV